MISIVEKIRFVDRFAPEPEYELLDEEAFQAQLLQERLRCERGGRSFTMLLMAVDSTDSEMRRRGHTLLVSILAGRLRAIDAKGWCDGCIGVILVHAAPVYAELVWRDIDQAYNKRFDLFDGQPIPPISHTLFAFPGDGGGKTASEKRAGCQCGKGEC